MAENDIRFVKAEECCSGVGTSPPSSIEVSLEQIQGSNGPQMKVKIFDNMRRSGTEVN